MQLLSFRFPPASAGVEFENTEQLNDKQAVGGVGVSGGIRYYY